MTLYQYKSPQPSRLVVNDSQAYVYSLISFPQVILFFPASAKLARTEAKEQVYHYYTDTSVKDR